MFKTQRIATIENHIRKIERGLRVIVSQQGINKATNSEIIKRGEVIQSYRDELEDLTGSREPSIPDWPV